MQPARRLPPKDERRALIVEAAITEFSARGPEAVTMDDVASAAGLSKPRVYDLFAGKDEVLVAAVRSEAERFSATVLASYEAAFGDAEAEVEALARGSVAYAVARPDGVRLLRAASAHDLEPVREAQRRARDAVAAAIAERIRFWLGGEVGRSADLLAEMLLGMSVASIDHRLARGLAIDADLADLHAAAALAVLRNVDRELLGRLDAG